MLRRDLLRLLGTFAAAPLHADAPALPPIVYLATYSHVDPDWLWPYQEGEQQADATFRSVLAVLDAEPDVKFSMTTAAHYRWIRTTDPALFDEIKAAVRGGRWEVLGGWWVEADTNVPSGESLMRQGLCGQREFFDHLGVRARIAFLPDSFGSSANLPAILQAQGFDGYVTKRGVFADGTPPPLGAFVYEGLGRSAILTYVLPLWNGSNDAVAKIAQLTGLALTSPPLVVFGLGDHGGGPSREAIRRLHAWMRDHREPHVSLARVDTYFETIAGTSDRRRGELEGDLVGSYANAGLLKRALDDAERALLDCERCDAIAAFSGIGGAPPDLDDDWRTLLLRQHHDTASGTTLAPAARRAVDDLRAVADRVRAKTEVVLERLVDRIGHDDPNEYVLAIVNPLAHDVRTTVVYDVGAGDFSNDIDYSLRMIPNAAFDASGGELPWQRADAETAEFTGKIYPIAFSIALPALGYAAVRLRKIDREAKPSAASDPRMIENEHVRVRFDGSSGQPSSIVDIATGRELLAGPSSLVVFDDTGDTWGRWGLSVARAARAAVVRAERVRVVERGPVRTVVAADLAVGDSRGTQRWYLDAGARVLRSAVELDWREPQTRLGFDVTPAIAYRDAEYDVPFGRVRRALDEQVHPAQSTVRVGAGDAAVAVVAVGSRAFWASPSSVGVNLLRAVPYAWKGEGRKPFALAQLHDIGAHRLSFGIAAGESGAQLARTAQAFDRTFPVAWVGVHAGDLAPIARHAVVDERWTLASVRRDPRHADRPIARLHDESGTAASGTIVLGGRTWSGAVDAYGIVTLAGAATNLAPVVDL